MEANYLLSFIYYLLNYNNNLYKKREEGMEDHSPTHNANNDG